MNFAQYQQLTFISAFWSTYFHVYLDYATYGTMTASQLLSLSGTQSGVAIGSGQFTPTGTAYENMFVKPIDTLPPTAPPGPGYTATTTQINLTWLSSSDNVGVAGYNIYRNGTLANTTSGLFFQDLNLTANTAYNYAIEAFDALKNTSPQTLITATTQRNPDTQPPTVPTGLAAIGTGVTQISLSWTASTDNVAVTGYKVYRGTSPTTVSIYSSSASNSFIDLNCSPTSTYYYSVAAYDAAGNVSAQSSVVSGRSLPDTVPPSVPTNLQTTAVASTSVSLAWTASTDNVKVSNYRIYRGTSPTTLQNIGSTTSLAYTDNKVTTKKTYYYTVAAVDTSKNVSAQSPAILVTTP